MSVNQTFPQVAVATPDPERAYRVRLRVAYWIAFLSLFAVLAYGYNYYFTSTGHQALSPKHALLKPGGTIGLDLGLVGFVLFLVMYIYPLRSRWRWLSRKGNSRHWLDVHVFLGIVAPLIITLHSSFRATGLAGITYWLMIVVALSGLLGRYIYAQVPRTLSYAELTLKEGQEQSVRLATRIQNLGILSPRDVEALVHLPDLRQAEQMSLVTALWQMMVFDVVFPIRMCRLRQKMLWSHSRWWSLVGFRPTQNIPLERAISLAKEQALLEKKVIFLSKSQRMLHLWHSVHCPCSYSFAVLATIHVVSMVMLGCY